VALRHWNEGDAPPLLVTCGLAASLLPQITPGTVVVPDAVALGESDPHPCEPELQAAFLRAAEALGYEAVAGTLVTVPSVVVGSARVRWARLGYIAADMETGLVAAAGRRVAAVRVVLDSPTHEVSERWERPAGVVLHPQVWPELLRLSRQAPRFALRAARVLAAGLARLDGDVGSQIEIERGLEQRGRAR
jgi:hypothetical protein